MGFGDKEKGEGGEEGATTVACSICLDIVTRDGDRSMARLQCGHQFHLDCIGSAFNAKGVMQCPNCRKVETGNWLYASSPRPLLEPSMDDWVHDEDLYELSYSEMPFGVHWCPFSRLTQAPSFEEGESSPPIAFHDLLGHHAIFTDHPTTSSAAHPCPYVSYLQPLQASSSSSSHVSSESPIDGPGYHHHWSHIPRLTDVQTAHALPSIDLQYHSWEHHSQSYSLRNSHIGGPEQASASSATRRLDIDGPARAGSLVHPFLLGHGSGSRARATSSFVPSLVPPYLRAGLTVNDHQNSQNIHGTIFAGIQRSGGSRGLATLGPTPLSLPDHTGFYLLPSAGPSGHSLIDAENSARSHFYASWERDQFVPYQLFPVERESAWWVPYSQSAGASDSSHRVGMWPRAGSERSSSQVWSENSSYQPAHVARVQSFMRGPNS